MPRAGVLGGVVERFLRDSIQRRLDVGREPLIQQTRGVQARGDADAIGPVLHVVGQRRSEAEVVERCRAQLPSEPIHVLIEAQGYRFEGIDFAGEVRAVNAQLLQPADPQRQRRQMLSELVVHVSSNAATLVLLGEHEPCQQLGAAAFGFRCACRSVKSKCVPTMRTTGPPGSRRTGKPRDSTWT